MTIFDQKEFEHPVKQMTYGTMKPKPRPITSTFRLERGFPYQRAGKLVPATPQFNTLTLYSNTVKNTQLPTIADTPNRIQRPQKNQL